MPVLRFFALQAAIGLAVATLFLGALLLSDPGGISTLLRGPSAGPLPLAMLWLFTGLTFGAAQFAAAVGLTDGNGGRGGRPVPAGPPRRQPALALAPARARVTRPRTPSP